MGLSKLFAVRNVTMGRPWKRILELTIPMLLGNFAQQFYNAVDASVVGKYIGDNALAAVGGASPILNLLLVLFVGISTGAGIFVAQRFGAKDREGLSKAIGNCITLTAFATGIIMLMGVTLSRPLLSLLDTPASVFKWSADYLTIFFAGSAGFVFYNILCGILRGMGDSFSALGFLLISTALNIGLDVWFVAGLGLRVGGVALATVIAQGVSAALCFIKLMRMRGFFDLRRSDFRPDAGCIRQILGLGLPSGISHSVFSISALLVQSLTNSLGETVMACNVIVMRMDGFAVMPAFSIGSAMTTYAGQNYGARRIDRLEKGARQGMLVAVIMSTALTMLVLGFGGLLAGWFTDTAALADLAVRMLRILAVGYILLGINQAMHGHMRGAGYTKPPMWIGIITQIVLRVPMAYLLAYFTRGPEFPNGRPEALYLSMVLSWALNTLLTCISYRRISRRLKRELTEPLDQPADCFAKQPETVCLAESA